MLDPALLRPGRIEVEIEIGLPDMAGRHQILKIHTNKVRSLTQPIWNMHAGLQSFLHIACHGRHC